MHINKFKPEHLKTVPMNVSVFVWLQSHNEYHFTVMMLLISCCVFNLSVAQA